MGHEWEQIGDASSGLKSTFVQVMASGVKAVAAGRRHSMVLKQDGSVWVAGDYKYGQLGDASVLLKSSFVQVIFSDAAAIAAGYDHDHGMVLKQDGSVWATGRSDFGQLGNGLVSPGSTLVKVISSATKAVAAGGYHSMVLKDDGSVWASGANGQGQLGDGSTLSKHKYARETFCICAIV